MPVIGSVMEMAMSCSRETWDEMSARHRREQNDMLDEMIAMRIPLADAARILGTDVWTLKTAVYALGIVWPPSAAPEGYGGG